MSIAMEKQLKLGYTVTEQIKLFGGSDFIVHTPKCMYYTLDCPKKAEQKRQQLIIHDFIEVLLELVAEINKYYKFKDGEKAYRIKLARNRVFEFANKIFQMRLAKLETLKKYISALDLPTNLDEISYCDDEIIKNLVIVANNYLDKHIEFGLLVKK
jgi:hypothetical protein